MPVGVAYVDETRKARREVALRAKFYGCSETSFRQPVTQKHQVVGFGGQESDVVQARPVVAEEHDIVRVPLALQENCVGLFHAVARDIFRKPKAHASVEAERFTDEGCMDLEMVEA